MKIITIKKLWKGKYVSLRDNWIKQGKKLNGIEVSYNGKSMYLTPDELDKGVYGGTYKSKYGKHYYKLYDFNFTPGLDSRQQTFFK